MPDFNTWVLLAVAAMNALTAYLTYKARQDIHTVEKATNSMKDALVAVTGESMKAQGILEGRAAVHAEADVARDLAKKEQ